MKYGYFTVSSGDKMYQNLDTGKANLGDPIQSIAVRHLYNKCGIDSDSLLPILVADMSDYEGEYVIVPISEAFSNYKRMNCFPLSDRILPIFISMAMCEEDCDDIIPMLKSYEPIGCRDEVTMNLMRRKGIVAYLSGCLTITLPKRKETPLEGKAFFVDVPDEVFEYVPEDIKKNMVVTTHAVDLVEYPISEEETRRIDQMAQKQIEMYKKEASLVVTSRLHAAAPCLAMGIPVILIRSNIDYRYSWLDKYIRLYTTDELDEVEWYPESVDVEDVKERITRIFKRLLDQATEKYADIYDLSEFYENRERAIYDKNLRDKLSAIRGRVEGKDTFQYIIWGAGVHGKLAFRMMTELYPKAQCKYFVDKYYEGSVSGLEVKRGTELRDKDFDLAIITTHPGRFEAKSILEFLGCGVDEYMFFMSLNEQ